MTEMTKALRHNLNLLEQQVAALRAERSTKPQRPAQVFHVVAGKYDGDEENCKFADTRDTLEEAEALLLTVSGYPWSRIEVA